MLAEHITKLNSMVLSGKALEAFDLFYHDDVIMQENDAEPTIGKSENRIREEEFFASITEFRGAEVLNVAVGEDVTMVEWKFDYTHKDWGIRNYTQVSVQKWKENKVVHEKFYYAG